MRDSQISFTNETGGKAMRLPSRPSYLNIDEILKDIQDKVENKKQEASNIKLVDNELQECKSLSAKLVNSLFELGDLIGKYENQKLV